MGRIVAADRTEAALLGGFIASKMGIGGGNIGNILIATAGAILLLIIYRIVRRPGRV